MTVLVQVRCRARGCGRLLAELGSEGGTLRLRTRRAITPRMWVDAEITQDEDGALHRPRQWPLQAVPGGVTGRIRQAVLPAVDRLRGTHTPADTVLIFPCPEHYHRIDRASGAVHRVTRRDRPSDAATFSMWLPVDHLRVSLGQARSTGRTATVRV